MNALALPALHETDRGDTFRHLFDEHASYVLRTLRRLGVRDADAEDLAHEVFLVVHRRLAELDGDRPARPWIFAICFRVAANHRRSKRRLSFGEPENDVVDPQPRSDEALEEAERRRLVLRALESLDLDRRAVFVMHCLDGEPIPAVAKALGIPLGTAYTRLRAAKERFTDAIRSLEKEGKKS